MNDPVVVRSLRDGHDGDDGEIRRIFCDTVLLGASGRGSIASLDRYADVCLGWYLTGGREFAAVAVQGGEVVGYALACPAPARQAWWSGRRCARLAAVILFRSLTGTLDRSSRTFYSARVRDARSLWSGGTRPPRALQVHLNVSASSRHGTVALALRDHLDRLSRSLGVGAWYGEINAIVGTREAALGRIGLRVIDRCANHTLSAMVGCSVERLTVVRSVIDPVSGGRERQTATKSS